MSIQNQINNEKMDQSNAAMEARIDAARRSEGIATGRKPMLDPAAQQALDAQRLAQDARPATVPSPRPRGSRKPFGAQEQTLSWPPVPGMRLYWFNETPGRIDRAKEAGYEHVRDDSGSPVKRVTGRGDRGEGLQSFLMQIPEEWHKEDQMAAQLAESEKLRNIQAGQTGNPNQYVPQQGIKMERR